MASLLNKKVTVPTGISCSIDGTVIFENEDTGKIIVLGDDGNTWHGFEYQIEHIEQ